MMAAAGSQPGQRDRISFPMYDQPFCRAATDSLYAAVRAAADAQGFDKAANAMPKQKADASTSLHHPALPAEDAGLHRLVHRDQAAAETVWSDPRLLLSQTCGQNLWDMQQQQQQQQHLNALPLQLVPLASPCYTARGCNGNRYCGLIIVRNVTQFQSLASGLPASAAASRLYATQSCHIP